MFSYWIQRVLLNANHSFAWEAYLCELLVSFFFLQETLTITLYFLKFCLLLLFSLLITLVKIFTVLVLRFYHLSYQTLHLKCSDLLIFYLFDLLECHCQSLNLIFSKPQVVNCIQLLKPLIFSLYYYHSYSHYDELLLLFLLQFRLVKGVLFIQLIFMVLQSLFIVLI
jgi:hypothetical protein